MPHLVSISFKTEDLEDKPAGRYARNPTAQATLTPRQGIVGDRKGGTGGRQLNVMRAETVADLEAEGFKTAPGELGEQLVVAGLPPDAATPGKRLRIGGSAVIEFDKLRTGCARFEQIQGRPKSAVAGRLGIMARVLVGGPIAVGDAVTVVAHSETPTQQSLF